MADRNSTARSRTLWIAAAIAWTIVILALCSIPGQDLPQVQVLSADKIAHFTLFAAFAWLWMNSLALPVRMRFAIVFACGLAYAVLTEVYQGLIPIGREPDIWDSAANAAGLLVGSALWWSGRRRSERDRHESA